jgi:hypothetical protein
VPPGRCETGVVIHQPPHCPLGASECATIRSLIGAPPRWRAHRILGEEVCHLHPHR